ncbi:MAG: twin-arginine translocation signal domain-containing protein, partial [Colwellia sp.]|uniref:twin-arginine translocation signal domain-containing protein n=1 Tax=Colwellia sp. TaxID=56799 RepID=UPI001DBA6C49
MISRRKFLCGLGIVGAVGAISTLPLTSLLTGKKNWLVSGCSDKKGNFFAAAFDLTGQLISKVALPARGHEVIAIKSKPG